MLTFNCTTKLDSSAHSNIFPECPSELATTVTLQIQYSTALYITMNLNRIASAQQQGKFYLPLFGISLSSLDDEINQLLGGFHLLMCQNNHKKEEACTAYSTSWNSILWNLTYILPGLLTAYPFLLMEQITIHQNIDFHPSTHRQLILIWTRKLKIRNN